jgi:Flp pilus assembly protein TadD
VPARVSLAERISPLGMGLGACAVLVLLAAMALVKATLNECRSGIAFRKVLRIYGGGESELAAQELPAVIAAKPRRYPHPRLLDALIKVRRGDLVKAREAYEDILAEQETLLTSREQALCYNGIGVAKILAASPKPPGPVLQEARDDFRKATESWPELPEPTFNLAALAWLEGRHDACRALLAESVASGRLPPTLEMARGLVVARAFLAEASGNWQEAVVQARARRAYDMLAVEDRLLLARALSRQLLAQGGGNPLEGVESEPLLDYCDERQQSHPWRVETLLNTAAWRMEGLRIAQQGESQLPDKAMAVLRDRLMGDLGRAAQVAPAEASVLSCIQACRDLARSGAHVAASAGDPAQRALEALLTRPGIPDRLRASAENNLGCLLVSAGKPGEALAHLQKAVEMTPGDPLPVRNLAVAMDRHGDAKAALGWYAKALTLRPAQPDVESRWTALKDATP